jgi:ribonuclease VapC
MFLDASAITAILAREDEASSLAARLGQAINVYTSPIAIYEATVGLARIANASLPSTQAVLDRFLDEVGAEIVPIDADVGRRAVAAFERFGKGRHPAALNMGDCFAYACAQRLQVPLLFKGVDFPLTDIAVA